MTAPLLTPEQAHLLRWRSVTEVASLLTNPEVAIPDAVSGVNGGTYEDAAGRRLFHQSGPKGIAVSPTPVADEPLLITWTQVRRAAKAVAPERYRELVAGLRAHRTTHGFRPAGGPLSDHDLDLRRQADIRLRMVVGAALDDLSGVEHQRESVAQVLTPAPTPVNWNHTEREGAAPHSPHDEEHDMPNATARAARKTDAEKAPRKRASRSKAAVAARQAEKAGGTDLTAVTIDDTVVAITERFDITDRIEDEGAVPGNVFDADGEPLEDLADAEDDVDLDAAADALIDALIDEVLDEALDEDTAGDPLGAFVNDLDATKDEDLPDNDEETADRQAAGEAAAAAEETEGPVAEDWVSEHGYLRAEITDDGRSLVRAATPEEQAVHAEEQAAAELVAAAIEATPSSFAPAEPLAVPAPVAVVVEQVVLRRWTPQQVALAWASLGRFAYRAFDGWGKVLSPIDFATGEARDVSEITLTGKQAETLRMALVDHANKAWGAKVRDEDLYEQAMDLAVRLRDQLDR